MCEYDFVLLLIINYIAMIDGLAGQLIHGI